ncbi:hypothetical protein EVAR_74688_1 [Eumeta japonica]|uniref:Uncharacterized protein n=1 Tax=Eumeta variegata TaxID=151549 RepID=A0A4C1YJ47_EUMVA|nr:hypothetical protein EVAR_74688_1 [Eumeta japonica]
MTPILDAATGLLKAQWRLSTEPFIIILMLPRKLYLHLVYYNNIVPNAHHHQVIWLSIMMSLEDEGDHIKDRKEKFKSPSSRPHSHTDEFLMWCLVGALGFRRDGGLNMGIMNPFRLFGNRPVMSPRRKYPFFKQSSQIMGVINIADFIPTGGCVLRYQVHVFVSCDTLMDGNPGQCNL